MSEINCPASREPPGQRSVFKHPDRMHDTASRSSLRIDGRHRAPDRRVGDVHGEADGTEVEFGEFRSGLHGRYSTAVE